MLFLKFIIGKGETLEAAWILCVWRVSKVMAPFEHLKGSFLDILRGVGQCKST